MTATVFEYLILIRIDFNNFIFSVFSLVLVSVEKIYQTLKTVFDHIPNTMKFVKNRIFNSFLCVWKWGRTRPFVFDILRNRWFCCCY